MDNIFNTFKHLVTRSQAWRLVASPLKEYIKGYSYFPATIKDFIDNVWNDIFPLKTGQISKWEQQFNIKGNGIEVDRRDGILARWRAQGGQGKDYLQDLIHSAGYMDVFIHEWWTDLGGGLYDTKNPNAYVVNDNPELYQTYCLAPDSDCGSPDAGCGILISGNGSILVNKGPTFALDQYQTYCLGPDSDCGSPEAGCGIYEGIGFFDVIYDVPNTVDDYRFVIYISGETFPDFVDIPISKRDEFERLLLTYFPAQQYLALLINYI